VTTETVGAQIQGQSGDADVRVTKYGYDGQSDLGWKFHEPTSSVVDATSGGLNLTKRVLYDANTGLVTETRMPANPNGGDAHSTDTIYYTAGANPADSDCGNLPEWANLACKVKPVAQPGTAGLPDLPVRTYTYNRLDQVISDADTVGDNTRTTTTNYDAAGRKTSTSMTATIGDPLPTVSLGYDSTTGLPTTTSTAAGSTTQTITRAYDSLGRLTSYTDADGNTSTTTYDLLGRPATQSDGKGTQTYTYDTTRGLLTQLNDSAAGTLTTTYDGDSRITTTTLPDGLQANRTYDEAGGATRLTYTKTTNCSQNCTWFDFQAMSSIHGQRLSQTSAHSTQQYTYDAAGRLTAAQDTPTGQGCTTRIYGYDADSNRASMTTRAPASDGSCAGSGGTSSHHTYDAADRLQDTGYRYDAFGRILTVPTADANGAQLRSAYYANDRVHTLRQGQITQTYDLDPELRPRRRVTTGTDAQAEIMHYAGGSDSPAWFDDSAQGVSTHWSRNILGIDGDLAAVQDSARGTMLEISNLHGDIVAEASLDPNAPKPPTSTESDEFGVPRPSASATLTSASGGSISGQPDGTYPRYGWLGAKRRPTELASGVILMGQRVYVPTLGRFLQTDPVPGGSANTYDYVNQDPVNGYDLAGTCSVTGNKWRRVPYTPGRAKASPGRAARAGHDYMYTPTLHCPGRLYWKATLTIWRVQFGVDTYRVHCQDCKHSRFGSGSHYFAPGSRESGLAFTCHGGHTYHAFLTVNFFTGPTNDEVPPRPLARRADESNTWHATLHCP
jgi:RHS repeat-associated protein